MTEENEKIPPHNINAEKSVLGACLLDRQALLFSLQILDEDDFFNPPHRNIFKAFKRMTQKNVPVDMITLVDHLNSIRDLGAAGGADYISGLTNTVPVIGHIEHYAEGIKEKSRLRKLLRMSHEIEGEIFNGKEESKVLIDRAMSGFIDVSRHDSKVEAPTNIEEAIYENEQYYEDVERGVTKPAIKLGFERLDALLTMLAGNMLVIGGRPSHGKTAIAVAIAINLMLNNRKTLYLSAEMDKREMTHRFLAAGAGIPISLLRKGTAKGLTNHPKVQQLVKQKQYLKFVCPPKLTELDVARIVKTEILMHGAPDLIIVDYLQRMRYSGRTSERRIQIGEIANSIKDLMLEVGIPGILLSQLTRPQGKDRSANKPPTIFDLKEAGEVENVADAIGLVHRVDDDKSLPIWQTDFLLEKNRNGPLGDIEFVFERQYALFREADPSQPPMESDNDDYDSRW